MPAVRDMALTVEEREKGQFFWVLIEAFDNEAGEAMYYRRFKSAATPQPSYSSALALGVAALRRLASAEPAPPGAGS
ncbi:hypothetical protein J7E62_02450 [Variovorax paradoxus]|nr:hypothetical protein [Variovorax paradoxus]